MWISRDAKLAEKVISNLETIDTKEKLYAICEDMLIPRLTSSKCRFPEYLIMSKASTMAFGNSTFWAEKNGLSVDEVRSKCQGKSKG